jgi:hypothetical protein
VRGVIRFIGNRYGVAAVIAVIVVIVIAVGHLANGDRRPEAFNGRSTPTTTIDPHAGDDGLTYTPSAISPPISPGAATAPVVALAFAGAWVAHTTVNADRWRAGLKPYSTASLTAKFSQTDPAAVPADRIIGPPTSVIHAVNLIDVSIPVDSGMLILRLVADHGRWLVDSVDWNRG